MHKLDNENSAEHWKFIDVKDRIVLDLGCGRWNKVERVEDSWLTTPEHFIANGAKKVIGLDVDPTEIHWFNNKFSSDNRYEFILKSINSTNDLMDLYNRYNPDCVKFDIETYERLLFNLDPNMIQSVKEYYIETHGTDLYNEFVQFLPTHGYTIKEQIDLIHTNGYCKVIFATK